MTHVNIDEINELIRQHKAKSQMKREGNPMTDELQELREKLAIAKQMFAIVGDRIHSVITFDGLTVDKSEGDIYFAYPKEEYRRPQESLSWGTDAIEVAYNARQKLAAERAEAAKSEREKSLEHENKKLREAMREIILAHRDDPQKAACALSVMIARQALES